MFKMCCGDCGECWYIGNPRTCKCSSETPKREWQSLTTQEIDDIIEDAVDKVDALIQTADKLREKNHG